MFGKLSLSSRERSYSIAPKGIIQPGTIHDSIEQISNPNHTPTTADYINFIVRYAVGYIHRSPTQRITQQIADDTLTILCDPSKRNKKEHDCIALCEYQLRMIFDIGATIEVVRDIVEREIDVSKTYTAVDAGSGTGITLLAQYLQARRHGIKRNNMINIGLEIDPNVAHYSDAFVRDLGIGAIFSENSTNTGIYKQAGYLHFFTNENIPYYKHPYSKLVDISNKGNTYNAEPFFENVFALKQAGIDLSQSEMFPRKISNKLHKTWIDHNGGVHSCLGSFEEQEILFSLEKIHTLKDEKDVFWHQTMLAPSKIFINNEWKGLDAVGDEYYVYDPYNTTELNRVLLSDNPLIGGRWNHTRIPGVSIDL